MYTISGTAVTDMTARYRRG